jgi:hypothetical protein
MYNPYVGYSGGSGMSGYAGFSGSSGYSGMSGYGASSAYGSSVYNNIANTAPVPKVPITFFCKKMTVLRYYWNHIYAYCFTPGRFKFGGVECFICKKEFRFFVWLVTIHGRFNNHQVTCSQACATMMEFQNV